MAAIKINKDNFESVIKSNESVLLDFYADWCGPCRMVAPIIEEIANENPDIAVGKINVDEEQELAIRYGVMSIPTVIFFKDGEEVARKVGVLPATQFTAVLDNYL